MFFWLNANFDHFCKVGASFRFSQVVKELLLCYEVKYCPEADLQIAYFLQLNMLNETFI